MLARRALLARNTLLRSYSSQARTIEPVYQLPNAELETFRAQAFKPAIPALLPRRILGDLPAISSWFVHADGNTAVNRSYFSRFGSTMVPVEISNDERFTRTEQSLSFCTKPNRYFSAYVPGARAVKRTKTSNNFFSASSIAAPTARVYLAQAAIANLPQRLRDDVPTPGLVLKAGKGDVYDSSIWLGEAPTFTPLHRDPNPNLFVQLAGTKVVRLLQPDVGRGIFAKVQEQIGGSASAVMRGEEMMQGLEKKALEAKVWDDSATDERQPAVLEARLEGGDGLFIPKGWWHSVKGIGSGMNGSVNWWFR